MTLTTALNNYTQKEMETSNLKRDIQKGYGGVGFMRGREERLAKMEGWGGDRGSCWGVVNFR